MDVHMKCYTNACVRTLLISNSFCVSSLYVLYARCLRVVCALSARCLRVVCALSARCLRVVCVLSACCLRVVCVLSACCLRVVCMLYARVLSERYQHTLVLLLCSVAVPGARLLEVVAYARKAHFGGRCMSTRRVVVA